MGRIELLQKRAVRVISSSKYNAYRTIIQTTEFAKSKGYFLVNRSQVILQT